MPPLLLLRCITTLSKDSVNFVCIRVYVQPWLRLVKYYNRWEGSDDENEILQE
jgi:hypothetical protein